ncbi:BA75_02727T0 [Komagataella pastoris]|uniref:BA75_02727T0 n=1 Tax=Komagataella pastoris TaxID=4922 RepID=A0A1B2JB24_PICPA|nr:BA75_02727T0 [Komagataella pastoris]
MLFTLHSAYVPSYTTTNSFLEKAKELGIWDSNDLPYEITESDLYANIPGRAMSLETPLETFPPPPSLPNLPNPPPAIYHYNTTEEKELISSVMREYQHRNTVK